MQHLFLINPAAGKADCSKTVIQAAQSLCQQLGQPCQIQVSTHPGQLRDLARQAGQSGQETRLYACGGDGTLNEVVSGAADFDCLSVTAIPYGSGNDFIKQFARPELFFDLNNFTDVVTAPVDLMDVSGNYCLNICSVGFDARIGTAIDRYRRLPLLSGPRAYHASVVVNLLKGVAKPCRVELEEGAVMEGDLTLVCVCNGSWYGGSYHPIPEANIQDGLLDVLAVKKVSRITVSRVISAYQKGRYASYPQLISHFRTRSLRIITPKVQPVNLDGELLPARDITIKVLPGRLKFFAPRDAWAVPGTIPQPI